MNGDRSVGRRSVPWDVEIARYNFGANCGPICFAALFGIDVCDALQFFSHFSDHRRTNVVEMKRVLMAASLNSFPMPCRGRAFPRFGVALVQWLGPWMATDFQSRTSLRHTHWIAVDHDWVFDHNAGEWLTASAWTNEFVPGCLNEIDHAAGWDLRCAFEITGYISSCPSTSAIGREVSADALANFNLCERTF